MTYGRVSNLRKQNSGGFTTRSKWESVFLSLRDLLLGYVFIKYDECPRAKSPAEAEFKR